jgi:hypothetical protein
LTRFDKRHTTRPIDNLYWGDAVIPDHEHSHVRFDDELQFEVSLRLKPSIWSGDMRKAAMQPQRRLGIAWRRKCESQSTD